MGTLLLNSHAVRHSLAFRTLKTERFVQLDLLGDKHPLGERALAYKQPAGDKKIARKMFPICTIIQQDEYMSTRGIRALPLPGT